MPGYHQGQHAVIGINAWVSSRATCLTCPDISNPSSGSVTLSTNGTLSQAEFSCSTGYHIAGDEIISCQTDGLWDGAEPLCVCDVPAPPTGGSLSLSGDNMTVYYSCDSQYTISGQNSQTCSTNGTGWAGVKPTCVSCPSLVSPSGGSVTVATDGLTSTAYYACDLGFTMQGTSTAMCTSSGVWDSVTPSCVQCASLDDPDSGSVTLTTDGEQTVASFTCVTGYKVSGTSPLTCQTDGQWSDVNPTCVCFPPLTPTNGQVEISADGLTASFTCSAGYTLKGVTTRLCQTNGVGWNEDQPSCETCDVLSNPSGGSLSITTSGSITTAEITCDIGYTINGGSALTCRTDGTWDLSVPSCGVCTALSTPTSGTVNLYSDNSITKANFTCETGYSLAGTSILACRADGSWDFTEPVCVKCTDLAAMNAGMIDVYTDGYATYASISCVEGYYVNGIDLVTCNADGSWDNELPTCVCSPPTNPFNGSTTLADDGMAAMFSCNLGFTLDGSVTSSCSTDGSGWDSSTPSCGN
ncbi:P-selectin-like [Ruditapes philippinarum]|uniref:P-selectin-like n=1 Tax=Ruditapes philippinarum TaxID=129788 RepID=UPI00295C392F|nr:P-selectin-like [Ruditapes philippinarum]